MTISQTTWSPLLQEWYTISPPKPAATHELSAVLDAIS
jgi:hypothetical protein